MLLLNHASLIYTCPPTKKYQVTQLDQQFEDFFDTFNLPLFWIVKLRLRLFSSVCFQMILCQTMFHVAA